MNLIRSLAFVFLAGVLAPTVAVSRTTAAVVELNDGRVLLNARQRTAAPHRLVVTSRDGATSWSTPRFDPALTEPVCMAGMVMIPAHAPLNRPRLVFTNPASGTRERKNLTARLSEDDGQTWSHSRSLESGPSAYSDLAVLPDGTILCFYERGLHPEKPSPYDALTLARFNVEWIMQPNVGVEK
jgi:sialidase-1